MELYISDCKRLRTTKIKSMRNSSKYKGDDWILI